MSSLVKDKTENELRKKRRELVDYINLIDRELKYPRGLLVNEKISDGFDTSNFLLNPLNNTGGFNLSHRLAVRSCDDRHQLPLINESDARKDDQDQKRSQQTGPQFLEVIPKGHRFQIGIRILIVTVGHSRFAFSIEIFCFPRFDKIMMTWRNTTFKFFGGVFLFADKNLTLTPLRASFS